MTSDERRDRTGFVHHPRTLSILGLVAVLGLVAGPLAAPAAGHAGADQVTLVARESGCPGDRTYCYEVTSGNLGNLTAGDQLSITLENPSSNSLNHNLHITQLSQANVGEDTQASAAFANTEDVAPGEQATIDTMVPSGSNGIYLWCTVGVHENQGMYRQATFGSGDTAGETDVTNSSPAPGTIVGLAALASVALALKRSDDRASG